MVPSTTDHDEQLGVQFSSSSTTGIPVARPGISAGAEPITPRIGEPNQSIINDFLDNAKHIGTRVTSRIAQLIENMEEIGKLKS
jgi:hypothetical protein